MWGALASAVSAVDATPGKPSSHLVVMGVKKSGQASVAWGAVGSGTVSHVTAAPLQASQQCVGRVVVHLSSRHRQEGHYFAHSSCCVFLVLCLFEASHWDGRDITDPVS